MAHVLLIDDDPLLRETLRAQLLAEGYAVTLAAHGGEGLRIIEAQDIDVVVCDILMPEQEGFEFLRKLRKRERGLPVIMITGAPATYGSSMEEPGRDYLAMASKLGADFTLRKPFTNGQLVALIGRALCEKG